MQAYTNRLHVVHVVESFGGGVIGFVEQICRYLPQIRHTVVHAVRAGEVDPRITQARFPAETEFVLWPHAVREIAPLADARALAALMPLLRRLRPDVLHLHSSKAGFLGRIAARLLGHKSVIYTPGGAALLRQDISPLKRSMYGRLEALAARFGGTVVACGQGEARALAAYGVAAEVIANGTEPGPEPVRADKAPGKPITVVTTGRCTLQKDPARFGRIAKALAGDDRFRFVWVGTGELAEDLPSDAVRLTGWVPAEQVRGLLEQADVYLSTAVWEGLSLAVLEAMAAGLPLLLSDIPGNADVVRPGVNGALFGTEQEAIDALRQWAGQPDSLAVMGQASRALLLAEHDVRQVAQRYLDLYYETAGR